MLSKSKSSVQDKKSTRNRTSVITTELNKRVHELQQCTCSVSVPHIELKVQSGSVLTTRASPVFKSSTSNHVKVQSANICEQNGMSVYQSSKSSVRIKTQIELVCRRIKRVCSSIKLAC